MATHDDALHHAIGSLGVLYHLADTQTRQITEAMAHHQPCHDPTDQHSPSCTCRTAYRTCGCTPRSAPRCQTCHTRYPCDTARALTTPPAKDTATPESLTHAPRA